MPVHTQAFERSWSTAEAFGIMVRLRSVCFHSSGQGSVRPAHLSLVSRVLFMVCLALPLALCPSISAHAAASVSTTIPTDLTATQVSFQGSGGITLHYTFRFFPGASHDIHQSPDGGVTSLPSLAPGYAELVGSWVQAVTSRRLPQADASVPPQQDWLSVTVPRLSWWESAWVQLVAFLLLLTAFAGYPLVALLRRLRGRSRRAAVGAPARLLSGTGATAVLSFFAYMLPLLIGVGMGGQEVVPDPLLAGRPLLWLILQTLALVTVGAEVATAVAWRRAGTLVSLGERRRLGLLLAGGALFVLWALYWGLLLP